MVGQVEAIFICAEASAPMQPLTEAHAVAGAGLAGDRYSLGTGFYSDRPRPDGGRELTLISTEMLDDLFATSGIRLDPVESRRNLLTSGIGLNELIGRQFAIGDVLCEGIDYCTPCEHLVELTGKPVLKPLVDRGGLRARIVAGGTIAVGAVVRELSADEEG
jgi:MOSC domain-containing protein YiiM